MHTLIIICSQCRQFIDIIDGQGVSGNSHGMCTDCLTRTIDEIKARNRYLTETPPTENDTSSDFYTSLDAVLLVDGDLVA